MKAWMIGSMAALLASGTTTARADSPPPADYWIDPQEDGSVVVYASGLGTCPGETGGLLRKNVDTQEIVRITTCKDDAFLDECVPAGHYQYGLATPYACSVAGSYYYAEATPAAPPEGCTRTLSPPVAADSVPWGSDRTICPYHYPGPGYGCGTGGGVLGMNLVLLLAGAGLWWARRNRRPA